MSDPEAAAKEWLSRSGFPLEFETARAFGDAGYRISQGLHYPSGDGTPREVDVLAVRELLRAAPRPTRITALRVIECKAARAPWVVLRGDHPSGKWEALDHLPLHPLRTEHVLEVLDHDEDPALLHVPEAPGFRAVVADPKSGVDAPYEAFTQAVGAARALVADNASMIPTIAFPTVVTAGPLFSARYVGGEELELERRDWDRVVWSGHPAGGITVVDVVTRAALSRFAAADATSMTELLELLYRAWIPARRELLEAEDERRNGPLRVSLWERLLGRFL